MDGHEIYVVLYPTADRTTQGSSSSGEVPSTSDLPDLAANDVIEVVGDHQREKAETPGWIRGRNRRTGVEGYFPSNAVFQYINKNELLNTIKVTIFK